MAIPCSALGGTQGWPCGGTHLSPLSSARSEGRKGPSQREARLLAVWSAPEAAPFRCGEAKVMADKKSSVFGAIRPKKNPFQVRARALDWS